MAIAANRQADSEELRSVMLDILGGDRLAYRELDSAPFDPDWVVAPLVVVLPLVRRGGQIAA